MNADERGFSGMRVNMVEVARRRNSADHCEDGHHPIMAVRRKRVLFIAAFIIAGALVASVALKKVLHSPRASWAQQEARDVVRFRFPALSEKDAKSLQLELASCTTSVDFEAIQARERRKYLSVIIQRKLRGEPINQQHYQLLLITIDESPADVAPADLRALLKNTSEQDDRETYITCLRAMGASGNRDFIPDVRAQLYNYWALKPYAQLARSEAIPDLLRATDLDTQRRRGEQIPQQEAAIEALGTTGDPDVLPILNYIGERQQVHRKAVELALASIDDPAVVTVAANMLSLPTDYPNQFIPDDGRWHSNEHSSARNVLERAQKYGVPPPRAFGPDDLKSWWEANRSKFPALESIRGDFSSKRDKFLSGVTSKPTTR